MKRYSCEFCGETVRQTDSAFYHSHPVCEGFRAHMASLLDVGPEKTIVVLDEFNARGEQVDVHELGPVATGAPN